MARSKVVYYGTTLMDITDTTATASDVAVGTYFYGADGVKREGSKLPVVVKRTTDENGGTVIDITGEVLTLQQKTISPTPSQRIVLPDEGYSGLSEVTVEPIPNYYVVPTGTLEVNKNGLADVTQYESVNVNVDMALQNKSVTPSKQSQTISPDSGYNGLSYVSVDPIPDEYIVPSGNVTITANGTRNIKQYETVTVSVSDAPELQKKTATPTKSSQTITPDSGYDGLSEVDINPIPAEYIIPTGELSVTSNGKKDVTQYSSIDVDIEPNLQSKSATPTKSSQTVTADSTYDGLSSVTVNPIPNEYIIPSGSKSITANGTSDVTSYSSVNVNVQPSLQSKTTTPTKSEQVITAESSYDGLSSVTVNPIPNEYIIPSGSKSITENGTSDVTAYASVSIDVQPDLQTKTATPTTSTQEITADSAYDGLSKVTVNPIPSQYIVPSGNLDITANGSTNVKNYETVNVDVQPTLRSESVTPTEFSQTVTPGTGYDGLSSVTVGAISSTYVGSEIDRRTSSDLTTSGATVTVPAGYYSSQASKSVATGTEGTPTVTKGTVSNNSLTVTPSVTNTAGYIGGGTHSGTGVTVTASELVSGTKTITENGTGIDVTNYASVDVNVSPNLQTKSVSYTPTKSTQTETVTADSGYDGLDEVSITVNPIPSNYITTADATATAAQINSGATAYVNGVKVTGTQVIQYYYTGTTDPSSSTGSDGDIYLKVVS